MIRRTATSVLALGAVSIPTFSAFAQTGDAADPWDLLSQIEIEEIITATTYEVRKVFPAALENGIEVFDITGYVVPMTDGPTVSEFILVSDIGFCPYCGSLDHGAALQVSLASPIDSLEEGSRITLRGSLETVTDPETWQATVMRDARVIEG